ncbi:hypothetical protein BpHYR1_038991 [Brachionus plicatilis]|uniref:Uncharacterized protein n=1 Tax=Brachionus plicatilis TaxID=10195 RepID=A0A3M7R6V7_BRAPC|nr:hypothetical protein BpHYR1_038991 [Brachionus plicatilis]
MKEAEHACNIRFPYADIFAGKLKMKILNLDKALAGWNIIILSKITWFQLRTFSIINTNLILLFLLNQNDTFFARENFILFNENKKDTFFH